MNRRTKATSIPQAVKAAVWGRDNHRCIICHNPQAMPVSHIVRRSQGGLGIVENIVTMCQSCHMRYDQSTDREMLDACIEAYMRDIYPDWDRSKLIYKKWSDLSAEQN